jgi:predicted lipoprotein with Yx(FWY)xxD motif
MQFLKTSRWLWLLGLLAAVTISCSDDDETDTPVPNDVQLRQTTAGTVLSDSKGMTLYFFTKDVAGASTCTGNCLANWPVFSMTNLATAKLDNGLSAGDFKNITRADGATQTTYKGWPLYYYKDDVAAGDAKGEGVGSIWFVAKTNYTVLLGNSQLVGNDGKSYKADYTEGTADTQFLTDAAGITLYAFARDSSNNNNFTTNVAEHDATWPIYVADQIGEIPSTLDKSQFATIEVFGIKQLTYKGWPLYYFGADAMARGATKGVSVPRPGVWPIVNKDSPNAPK